MTPLDVREWLEAEWLAGNPFAGELLELVACEPEANENAEAIGDLVRLAPEPIQSAIDRWRLVEWIGDRLALLEEVEALVTERCEGVTFANGSKPADVAETLTAAFDSDRLRLLDDVETLLQDHASDVMAPNGLPHKDAADWLEAVFQSPRWQQFDL